MRKELTGDEIGEQALLDMEDSELETVEVDGKIIQRNRTEGYVIECDGEHAIIAAKAGHMAKGSKDYWAVGQMISMRVGENRPVGLIYRVDAASKEWHSEEQNTIHIYVELIGEVRMEEDGSAVFSNGISGYPYMGAIAHRIRATDLQAIYVSSRQNSVQIGHLSQDMAIPALINIDNLLARHFAVVGTTGVGKSTAVTLLLRKIVEKRPDIRILVLDPHSEFSTAFPNEAIAVDANKLDLPFWVFKHDELVDVIYRGQPPVPAEVDALRDYIPIAKERFKRSTAVSASLLIKREVTSLTADTPVPYRMADLLAIIEERIGQLEGKAERPHLKALRNRLESLINDPRFRFMFGNRTISDSLSHILSHVFRIPQDGKPICVFEMSNLPSEVVNAVTSVLCRMAFDLALSSDGAIQTLVVCEEAHRYIPADRSAGFWPTRQAIARIAKEGRKYGVYLGVVTQRPGELDQTILSQCNTVFAMRLGNDHDQQIIKKAITGAAHSTVSFLSSVANRECIAFGEALHTPMRMVFETIAQKDLPGAHIYEQQARAKSGTYDVPLLSVIQRMREGGHDPDEIDETGSGFLSQAPSIEPDSPRAPAPAVAPDAPAPAGPQVWSPQLPEAEKAEPPRRTPKFLRLQESISGSQSPTGRAGYPGGGAEPRHDHGPEQSSQSSSDLIRSFRKGL